MIMHASQIPEAFAAAFNQQDIDALLALYTDDAVSVPDGSTEVPRSGLRAALEGFLRLPGKMSVTLRRVVVVGDTALVVADWKLPDAGVSGTTSDVLRRGSDGGWRHLIDCPFGIK